MAFMFKYESIFDHNPTREELADFGYETEEEIEQLKKWTAKAKWVDFWRLCFLFDGRGQKRKVKEYLNRARKEGYRDMFTLEHELAGGCLRSI